MWRDTVSRRLRKRFVRESAAVRRIRNTGIQHRPKGCRLEVLSSLKAQAEKNLPRAESGAKNGLKLVAKNVKTATVKN